jgi:hypothetical protein
MSAVGYGGLGVCTVLRVVCAAVAVVEVDRSGKLRHLLSLLSYIPIELYCAAAEEVVVNRDPVLAVLVLLLP